MNLRSEDNPNNDYLVSPGATDSINDIAWHPTNSEYIAAGSCHEMPVLSVCFNGDGTKIFSGSCDNTTLCWDLVTDKPLLAAQHEAPVKYVHWMDERNCLMTASWYFQMKKLEEIGLTCFRDKTIKYWDGRCPKTPVITYELEEKVYAADVKDNLGVFGLAEKHVLIFDLNYPQKPFRTLESPLKFQTRSISCFIDYKGYAIGSIEGRVAIHHCELTNQNLNFAFKCHRDSSQIFAINSIDFHPIYNTFATAGSDGQFHFWDKDAKQRLKQFKKMPMSITCSKFNTSGNIFAYAVGYDWSQGYEGYKELQAKNSLSRGGLYLHSVAETEIKGRTPRRF